MHSFLIFLFKMYIKKVERILQLFMFHPTELYKRLGTIFDLKKELINLKFRW